MNRRGFLAVTCGTAIAAQSDEPLARSRRLMGDGKFLVILTDEYLLDKLGPMPAEWKCVGRDWKLRTTTWQRR